MRFLRIAFAAAFVWCALVEVAEQVAGRLFGMEIDGDWYLLVTGSSPSAMGEFVRLYWCPLAIAAAGFSLLVLLAWALAFQTSRRRFLLVLALAAAFVGVRAGQVGSLKAWKPLYVAFDTVRGMRLYGQIAAAGEWTPERAAQTRAVPSGATNYVFVIGESMTSKRISFYGYGRQTTPRLADLGSRLAKLGPVRVTSPYTVLALPNLFIRDGVSAPVRFRQAGYETFFVGSHHRWARYCSVETSVLSACEHKVYLSETFPDRHIYDEMLLPFVKEMVSGTKPFVLFVHIMGSHFNPRDRVPEGFAADEGLDDYDRSIRYSDRVLADIIALLPPRTVLYYISDHGESTDTDGWRNMKSEAMWSVPVFAYPAEAVPVQIRSIADFSALWYNLSQP